uniref:E3 ubiquitin-protein ligase n=1 Tax=Heterorhabditis bacteriophora TaxID=37862 RepID=A0A1I7XTU0_HETBA
MGNDKSKLGSSSSHSHYQDRTHTDPRVDRAFKRLAGSSDTLCYKKLLDNFSKDLSEKLWAFLSENRSTDVALTFKDFSQHASELMGNSTDIYIVVCQSVHSLLKICSEAAGVSAIKGDEQFISNVVQGMILGGHSLQHIIAWKNTVCPKFCHALQCLVLHKLLEYDFPSVDYSSDILSPLQMWYIHCSLPSVYFPADNCKWTPLYTSTTQGISINRFETTVFDYRGPTVSIFHLTDLRIIVLATDQEWRLILLLNQFRCYFISLI